MKKMIFVFLLTVLLFMVNGCGRECVYNTIDDSFYTLDALTEKAQIAYDTYSVYEINDSLKEIAKLFAVIVNSDQEMKNFIGQEVGKKFDDDYDVLFDHISKSKVKGRTLEKMLDNLVATEKSFKSINLPKIISSVPYLNLAIPVNFDQWFTYDKSIYVIPLRYDEDDLDIKEYIGYDQFGNTKVFDASVAPDFPVLVVGINERIEYLKYKEEQKSKRLNDTNTPSSITDSFHVAAIPPCDGSIRHTEVLQGIYLYALTPDPWLRGNPEFYLLVAAGDNEIKRKFYYEHVDDTNKWYYFDVDMFPYNNIPEFMNYYVIARDYDGNESVTYNINQTFNWEGETYPIRAHYSIEDKIGEGDDDFGSNFIPFWHAQYDNNWTLGNATIRVGYRSY